MSEDQGRHRPLPARFAGRISGRHIDQFVATPPHFQSNCRARKSARAGAKLRFAGRQRPLGRHDMMMSYYADRLPRRPLPSIRAGWSALQQDHFPRLPIQPKYHGSAAPLRASGQGPRASLPANHRAQPARPRPAQLYPKAYPADAPPPLPNHQAPISVARAPKPSAWPSKRPTYAALRGLPPKHRSG